MSYMFRSAAADDYEQVITIFERAIQNMNESGIYQWDEVYPDKDILLSDIKRNQMYVLTEGDTILSVIVLNEDQDELYKTAGWKYKQGRIAVIHRLCVNTDYQNMGIGKAIVRSAEAFLKEKGFGIIRLDAFLQNPYALRMYGSLGYSRAGEVSFRKGKFCLYEKKLS